MVVLEKSIAMTGTSSAILEIMNSLGESSYDEFEKIILKHQKYVDGIVEIIKEMIRLDEDIFYPLFILNFKQTKQCEIIAKYYGVDKLSVITSPKVEEVIAISTKVLTCEVLAKFYENISTLYPVGKKDFVVLWYFINTKDYIIEMLLEKKVDQDLLVDSVKAYLNKLKKTKELTEKLYGGLNKTNTKEN